MLTGVCGKRVTAVVELLLWGDCVCGCTGNEAESEGIQALAAAIEAGQCKQLQYLDISCEQPNAAASGRANQRCLDCVCICCGSCVQLAGLCSAGGCCDYLYVC